jgi:hypothetical protein
VPVVYHDSGSVGGRRQLWRGRGRRGGAQVADSAALAQQALAWINQRRAEQAGAERAAPPLRRFAGGERVRSPVTPQAGALRQHLVLSMSAG